MKKTGGFTLVELIIVIAVIGILAAILIPTFSNVIDKANSKSALSDARNSVTEYLSDISENGNAPKSMVIVIEKAKKFWLYGYCVDGGGSIQVSTGNPFDVSSIDEVVTEWSWNYKRQDIPGPDADGSVVYDINEDGAFYLVPYNDANESQLPDVRYASVTRTVEAENILYHYRNLSEELITEDLGSDGELQVFHGILLPGTYDVDASPVVVQKEQHFVRFENGTEGPAPETVTLPEPVLRDNGATVALNAFSAESTDEDWIFDGWQLDGVDVTAVKLDGKDVTVTAKWKEVTKYDLLFTYSGGTFSPASGMSSNLIRLTAGTDITDYVKGSSVTGSSRTFLGWKYNDTLYTSSYSGIITMPASNVEFVAEYQEEVTITFVYDNGTSDSETVNVEKNSSFTISDKVTAPTYAGHTLTGWKSQNTGSVYGVNGVYTASENDTLTAQWSEDYFYIQFAKTIPQDATNAGVAVTVPFDGQKMQYPVGTASVSFGTSTLPWYYLNGYAVANLSGTTTLSASATEINTSGATAGTTVIVTPQWLAKTATFTYTSTNAQDMPSNETCDLISLVSGGAAKYYLSSTVPTNPDSSLSFVSWIYNDGGTETRYPSGSLFTVNEADVATTREYIFVASFDSRYETYTVNVSSVYDAFNGRTVSYSGTLSLTITMLRDGGVKTFANYDDPDSSIEWVGTILPDGFNYGLFDTTDYFLKTLRFTTTNGVISPSTISTLNLYPYENKEHGSISVANEGTIAEGGVYEFVQIYTPTGMKNMAGTSSNNSPLVMSYELMNDIDLQSSYVTKPLGYLSTSSFDGIFDGQGHTISNLSLNISGGEHIGLFLAVGGAVENLNLNIMKVYGDNNVGAVAGDNWGLISNVTVTVPSGSSNSVSAGIFGRYGVSGGITGLNSGSIRNCKVVSATTMAYTNYAYNILGAVVDNSYGDPYFNYALRFDGYSSDMTWYCGAFVGGIAGANDNGEITSCIVGDGKMFSLGQKGIFPGTNDRIANYVGGIAGINHGGTISQCGANNVILNDFNTDKTAGGNCYVGGVTGGNYWNSTISDCYASVEYIQFYDYAGGIAGYNANNCRITNGWERMNYVSYGILSHVQNEVGSNSGTVSGTYAVNGYSALSTIGTILSTSLTYIPSGWNSSYWAVDSNYYGPRLRTAPTW